MKRPIWDLEDGGFLTRLSDTMAMDDEGDLLLRVSNNMALNMDSGDLHFTSTWKDDDDE